MASPLKSPGVSLREIDISGPTALTPQGIPAGVIGTAQKGRAFVPVTFATYQDFVAEFGESDGEKFGPLAVNEWMKNARSGAYVRVLGIGDGKKRQEDGRVNNAGFVVGSSLVQTSGFVGSNPYANSAPGNIPEPGRTHFLASFLKATTAGSAAVFNDAFGEELITETQSYPILRGVIFAASGVNIALATDSIDNNTPSPTEPATFELGAGDDAGASHGKVITENGKQTFIMLLNGHKPSDLYSNVITASFDPTAADYFANVLNTDPLKVEEAGHLLYAHYDVHPAIAVPDVVGSITTTVVPPAAVRKRNLVSNLTFDRVPDAGASVTFTKNDGDDVTLTFVAGAAGPNQISIDNPAPLANAAAAAAALNTKINAVLAGFFSSTVNIDVVTVTGVVALTTDTVPSIDLAGVSSEIIAYTVNNAAASGEDLDVDLTFADVPLAGTVVTLTTGDNDDVSFTFVAGAAVGPNQISIDTPAPLADATAAATALANAINANATVGAYFSASNAFAILNIIGDNTPAGTVPPAVTVTEPDAIVEDVTFTAIPGINSVTTVTLSDVPLAGTAVTLTKNDGDEVTLTFVAGAAGANEISIDGLADATAAATALANKIDASLAGFFDATTVGPSVTITGFVGLVGSTVPSVSVDTVFDAALLLTGAGNRNEVDELSPNYENFEDRFQTAATPWFISQKFGGKNKRLFKIHSIDDGAAGSNLFKITIENITASNNVNYKYGSFDLLVRDFNDTDIDPVVLESFRGLTLDPNSARFISRVIGDRHAFYDLDQSAGRQKLRIEGSYPNASRYIRVETDVQVQRAGVNPESLPVGFAGFAHTNTSGKTAEEGDALLTGYISNSTLLTVEDLAKVKEPPVPMRGSLSQGVGIAKKLNSKLTWGVQFETQTNPQNLNSNAVFNKSISSFAKYFPNFQTGGLNFLSSDNSGAPDLGAGIVVDCDSFNNNKFTLENVQVVKTISGKPDSTKWGAAVYRRDGSLADELVGTDGTVYGAVDTKFIDPTVDLKDVANRQFIKFTCMAQGGFDGVNIFDREKSKMTDLAARREFDDELKQGGVFGPTIAAYRKAIDVLGEKTDVDIQLLATPGLRHPTITDYAIDAVENRFDAMYIMDVEEKDQENSFMTGSAGQLPSVSYTVNNFKSRNLDTSFAAAYYPDLIITDPATRTNIQVPPSVPVLGAFALNDATAYPWFAPAGFTRGALYSVLETQVKLSRANMDTLYDADINPVTSFADSAGVVVFGQKTLQQAQTSLDRVNVRRLLISIRRRVRRIAESFIFEPNRAETLARFSNLVTPVLQQIQSQNGVDRFKVQIDTSTTTQADVENNTVRGKIFVQPTRAVEFISLDFVITNQGANI